MGIRYRSKWEVEAAKIFVGCGVEFEYERPCEETKTFPDFYIAKLDRYLEIHPDCHGVKKAIPSNCVLVKTMSHARAAAFAISLRVNPEGVAKFTKRLSTQALRGLLKIGVDVAAYFHQAIEEQPRRPR